MIWDLIKTYATAWLCFQKRYSFAPCFLPIGLTENGKNKLKDSISKIKYRGIVGRDTITLDTGFSSGGLFLPPQSKIPYNVMIYSADYSFILACIQVIVY